MRILPRRLLPLCLVLTCSSPREWPSLVLQWVRNPTPAGWVEGFLAVYRERTWPATPDAVQQACAYATLTTRTWFRFHIGMFADNIPLLLEVCEAAEANVADMVRAALSPAVPTAHTLGVGLTPLSPAPD